MKGKTILEDTKALSQCVETTVIGHLWSHCSSNQARFSYWRNQKEQEIVVRTKFPKAAASLTKGENLLASAILCLLTDKKLALDYSQKGRERACDFEVSKVVAKYTALLKPISYPN